MMNKKILIIEDNEENLEIFDVFLRASGCDTLLAKNGREGVECAKTGRPHLILMDIQMPDMDGFQALKILKSQTLTEDIPCIAFTSHHLKNGRRGFIEFGFADYIEKPVKLGDLINTIRGFFEKRSG